MYPASLDDLISTAKSKPKKRIAVAAADDEQVLKAIDHASGENIIEPVLFGNEREINKICNKNAFNLSSLTIIHEKDPVNCAKLAVHYIKKGKADILMKGNISTAPLLKAVLDKENGLRQSNLLSHIALIQTSYYHKLLAVTDAAINISPSLEEKISIIVNAVEVFHKLGKYLPKIAILCPLETINEKIQSTLDAGEIKKWHAKNLNSGCLIDGPLALDNAVSKEAASQKGIISSVAGDADILLVPDLNAGNILYKSMVFLSDGLSAAIITGAEVPVVLTSRADSDRSKLYSIALAAALN